jgi:hypothetical protein
LLISQQPQVLLGILAFAADGKIVVDHAYYRRRAGQEASRQGS